jgi:hypothetical protein
MKLPNLAGCDGLGSLSPRCYILPIIYLIIIFIVIKRVTKLNNFLSGSILFGLLVLALRYKRNQRPNNNRPPNQ